MALAKRILGALGLVALGIVLWWAWDRDAIMAWKHEAAPVPFFAAMAILPAIGVPITPFFVLAGATFGAALGLLGSGVALGLNLTLCYAIARSGLRPRVESLLRRFEYELPDFQDEDRSAVRFTLLVKMTPGPPAMAKNYLLGLTGVPFPLYFGSSMLITGGYAALCVVVGVSLFEHHIDRGLVIGAIVIVLAAGLFWLWRKRSRGSRSTEAPAGGYVNCHHEGHASTPGRIRP